MRKPFLLSIVLFVLFSSCSKDQARTSLTLNEGHVDKESSASSSISSDQGTTGNCSEQYYNTVSNIFQNGSSLSSMGYTSIGNEYVATLMSNAINDLASCENQNGNDGGESNEDNTSEAGPSYVSLPEALAFVKNRSVNNRSVMSILVEAQSIAMSNLSGSYPSTEVRMLAIAKAVHEMGYGGLYGGVFYIDLNGATATTSIPAVRTIEALAGKIPIPYDLYNLYVASNASEYLTYPIASGLNWIWLTESSNSSPEQFATADVSLQINYNSNMAYYTAIADIFNTVSDLALSTPVFFNAADNKLYSNSTFSSFIPNGFYRLPLSHPSVFERNNYLVQIENGEISTIWGR